jgi:hypothetical protein
MKLPINRNKINTLIFNKRKAISPVIATVLLIGLVVLAGLGVALVIFGSINAPDPLNVEVVSISSFETTDDDYLVDKFVVTIYNKERTNVKLYTGAFSLSFFNRTEIPGWFMDLDAQTIIIPALNLVDIPLACETSENQAELTPTNTTIFIYVTVFPEGNNDPRSAKTFRSGVLTIGETYGPFSLVTLNPSPTFGLEGHTMNFSVSNSGSSDIDLKLRFSTSASEKFFFTINSENSSTHVFSLDGFASTSFQTDLFQLNSTALATQDTYLIFVSLLDDTNQQLLALDILTITFEP